MNNLAVRLLTQALRQVGFVSVMALLICLGVEARADGTVTNCTEQALRAAVAEGGRVTFSGDCSITLTQSLALGLTSTTIDATGHQVTISGGGSVRLFDLSGSVTLIGLTLVNGKSTTGGGALQVNHGAQVILSNCVLSGHSMVASNGVAGSAGSDSSGSSGGDGRDGTAGMFSVGGAIWNAGTLTMISCTLSNNTALGGDGGKGGDGGDGTGALSRAGDGGDGGHGGAAFGGAVYNEGDLILLGCTLAANSAVGGDGAVGGAAGAGAFPGYAGRGGAGGGGFGAGVYNAHNITVSGCTFSANTCRGGSSEAGGTQSSGMGDNGSDGADAAGGGLCSAFWAVVTNTTFYGNVTVGGKGGNGGPATGTLATSGRGGDGGDGFGGGFHNSGTAALVNCTFAAGAAEGGTNGVAGSGPFVNEDGDPGRALGGNAASTSGSCTLINSLIALDQSGGCGFGAFVDGGYNMTTDDSILLGDGSFRTEDPKLGTFGMNGGPTATVPLSSGSPALDRIPRELSPPTDQRGVPRPLGTTELADIGAYEAESASPPVIKQGPEDQAVRQGAAATFTVSAFGASSLQYQWFFGGSPLSGATSSRYTVLATWSTNLGYYHVVVTNNYGSATSQLARLSFVRFSVSGFVREGTNGVPNVTINASGGEEARTGADGAFSLALPTGTNFLTPSLTNYSFSPLNLAINVDSAVTGADFVAVPRLGIALLMSGQAEIYGGGIPGLSYRVEVSTNLVNWELHSIMPGPIQYTEPILPGVSARFYRFGR